MERIRGKVEKHLTKLVYSGSISMADWQSKELWKQDETKSVLRIGGLRSLNLSSQPEILLLGMMHVTEKQHHRRDSLRCWFECNNPI
jgi:hypothetical protein